MFSIFHNEIGEAGGLGAESEAEAPHVRGRVGGDGTIRRLETVSWFLAST
jgi:hypothetical protein